ncbi:hypothetical protein CYMTET_54979 [Cymbomonas tetramitiformis]|uniref:PsbP C-terminal domain-containing protein n=1 Tax=Cymbomonas tetramitiformis TaxID=36881 RepID=A0AAE0EN76_9CHLO|nr:hypothetical protein CYMTET_54979 [Cymbomonas tetramitiformis]
MSITANVLTVLSGKQGGLHDLRTRSRGSFAQPARSKRCEVRCKVNLDSEEAFTQVQASRIARRTQLLGTTTAFLLPTFESDTQAQELEGFKTYSRAFRERFETSISSATQNYSFLYPEDWSQDIVSLNDGKLYGVDLRMSSKTQGQLAVSVLPYASRETIEELPIDDAINTFIELVGAFWDDNGFGDTARATDLRNAEVRRTDDGQVYYMYELDAPHSFVAANCTDGQLYLMNVSATGRQWKKSEETLRSIINSFSVPRENIL